MADVGKRVFSHLRHVLSVRQQRNDCNLTADYGSIVLITLYVYEHRLLLELIRDREFTVGCWEIVDILINADVE